MGQAEASRMHVDGSLIIVATDSTLHSSDHNRASRPLGDLDMESAPLKWASE